MGVAGVGDGGTFSGVTGAGLHEDDEFLRTEVKGRRASAQGASQLHPGRRHWYKPSPFRV